MNIKQYKQFQFKFNEYNPLKGATYYENPISYVELFLYRSYGYIYRVGGVIPFLANLQAPNGECGMTFDMVNLNIDMENNLVYLGEIFDPYEHDMTEQEFKIKTNYMTDLQLCQNNIIDCAVMTKENFIHLLTAWGNLLNLISPFILLYQDDQNWYEVLPFDSQEAMEKFITDHSQRN